MIYKYLQIERSKSEVIAEKFKAVTLSQNELAHYPLAVSALLKGKKKRLLLAHCE